MMDKKAEEMRSLLKLTIDIFSKEQLQTLCKLYNLDVELQDETQMKNMWHQVFDAVTEERLNQFIDAFGIRHILDEE